MNEAPTTDQRLDRLRLIGRSSIVGADVKWAVEEIERLNKWVSDLQSGMYVNCVYCGHRYGPGETTPVSMADALKAHVEQCPKHPMSTLRAAFEEACNEVKMCHDKPCFCKYCREPDAT
jgi:hypothetical protein